MNELTVRITVTPQAARACMASIQPEIDSDIHSRSKVKIEYNRELVLRIEAVDLHAMRAAANTYLRWLDMCCKLTS